MMADCAAYKMFVDIQVRFRDTDAMGHVNNAVYLSYLELARVKYWERLLGLRDYSQVDFILVRVEIDYRSPVEMGNEIRVYIRVSSLGRSSWVFDYRIVEQATGRLVAQAQTVQCRYDYRNKKVLRMDESVRKKIADLEGFGEEKRR
ncbi:MAG: acyl-CoA thioesterase [Elusimicrobia bacterium]|nr:acyl-CoA thioesterase [Elusimicrobiota bacterium]